MPTNGNFSSTEISNAGIELNDGEHRDDSIFFLAMGMLRAGTLLSRDEALGYLRAFDGTLPPCAVLTYAVAAYVDEVDVPARVLVAGAVRRELLLDSTGAVVDESVIDQLQSTRIIAIVPTHWTPILPPPPPEPLPEDAVVVAPEA